MEPVNVLDSLGIIIGYGVILTYAWRLLNLEHTSNAWRRAWLGVTILSLYIISGRLMILVDMVWDDLELRAIFNGPIIARGRAWLAMLALLGICVELARIFLVRPRRR